MQISKIFSFALKTLANFLIIGAVAILLTTYGPWLYGNAVLMATKIRGITWQATGHTQGEESLIKALVDKKPIALRPVNSSFSLVIPKIGLTVPVIEGVNVSSKNLYLAALRDGVAHAEGTSLPGQNGNAYLFAHSGLDFWELGPYAASFNLLNRLSPGDEILVYYNNNRYVYKVLQTEIVKGWDTVPYYRDFLKPMLTLQTCDPPGTTINRLLVLAELVT